MVVKSVMEGAFAPFCDPEECAVDAQGVRPHRMKFLFCRIALVECRQECGLPVCSVRNVPGLGTLRLYQGLRPWAASLRRFAAACSADNAASHGFGIVSEVGALHWRISTLSF